MPLSNKVGAWTAMGLAQIIIIGAVIVVGVSVVLAIVRIVSNLLLQIRDSVPLSVLAGLKQEMESGEFERRQQEPKSLSGMDTIYGPQIQADFPELNLEELKKRAERLAYSTLTALDARDTSLLSEPGHLYRSQVAQVLARQDSLKQHDQYRDITLHRIVLSEYRKSQGTCRIGFEMAIGAIFQRVDDEGHLLTGHDGITQFKLTVEALYVQEKELLDAQELKSLAFNCPNCGAPMASLGDRQCPFCGSAVEPLNNKVWTFSGFQSSLDV